jgi:putative transposase
MVTSGQRRTAVTGAKTAGKMSERRACRFTGLARSSQRYASRRPQPTELRERLHTLALLRPRWGYRRLYQLSRREGRTESRILVQRIYQEEGLQVVVGHGNASHRCACRWPSPLAGMSAGVWTLSVTPWATGESPAP